MSAYYNEFEPYVADWLENLIAAGHLPAGDVDRRSIEEVLPNDLEDYTQCHFFAGIGGWPYALRLAGWPDDRPVWTASPPCQDYSVAGSIWNVRAGADGRRGSLTGSALDLVEEIQPTTFFFENVPGIQKWLAPIKGRLEASGYTLSVQNRTAGSVGAPCLRRRLWMAADRNGTRLQECWPCRSSTSPGVAWRATPRDIWRTASSGDRVLADGISTRVDAIRAFGNSINPQVAAEFIADYLGASA